MRDSRFRLSERERSQLRLIRLEQGWTYREMSGQIDIPEATLRQILEGAHKTPRQTTVYRLRKWLQGFQAVEAR